MPAEQPAPEPGAGNVEIVLEGKTHVLVPTLKACLSLSRGFGGITGAMERCGRLDFDTIVEVIAQGLNVNPAQKERFIEPAVYSTGMVHLYGDCMHFLRVIANGGREPDDQEEEGEEAGDPLAGKESQSENSTAG